MKEKKKKVREYRGVMDEIHEQHLKLHDMSLKEKLSYLWEYYRIHALVIILLVSGTIYFIHTAVTAKDYCFYAIMLNVQPLSSDMVSESFAEYSDLDTETYDCFIDTSTTLTNTEDARTSSISSSSEYDMITMQKILAVTQTGELDAIVFEDSIFETYAQNEMFLDLRTVLSSEELEQYEEYLYYADYESEPRVPVGILLNDSPFVKKSGCYAQESPVYGICVSSQHLDTAVRYLQYLFDESVSFDEMMQMPLQ